MLWDAALKSEDTLLNAKAKVNGQAPSASKPTRSECRGAPCAGHLQRQLPARYGPQEILRVKRQTKLPTLAIPCCTSLQSGMRVTPRGLVVSHLIVTLARLAQNAHRSNFDLALGVNVMITCSSAETSNQRGEGF